MSKGSDVIAQFLHEQGVGCVFELVGGMIVHLLDSIHQAGQIRIVSMHHEQSEDHYRDLLATLAFLDGRDSLPRWKALFSNYQQAMLRLADTRADDGRALSEPREILTQQLRRVMVRTERLAASLACRGC